MAKTGGIRAGQAFVELYADSSRLVRGLKIAERRLRNFGRSLQSIGKKMTAVGMAGLVPAGIGAKWFADFDDAMRQVRAVTGATGQQFDSLTDKARALGRSTSFTAKEVAGAMLELGRAGFAPTEIDAAIAGMLDLARATGTDLPTAAGIAASTMRGFGIEASDMTHVADVLVATANTSAQTLEDLGESMKYVAPLAAEAGLSLEDTAKAIGTMANMGIKGSMAGTSLRMALLRLSNADVQKMLREVGVEALDASGNLRNLGDVMVDIGKAMATMPNAQRLAWMQKIFNARAVTGSIKLATATFDRLNQAIDNASGTAQTQAAQADAGVGGSFRKLASAAQDVEIALGKALAPRLKEIAGLVTDASNRLASFVKHNQKLVIAVTGVSGALVIAGPALVGFGSAVFIAANMVNGIGTALSLVLTPIGLVGLAVAGLTAVFIRETKTGQRIWDDFTNELSSTMDLMKDMFSGAADAIRAGNIESALAIVAAGIRVKLVEIQNMFDAAADKIADALDFSALTWSTIPSDLVSYYEQLGKQMGGISGYEAFVRIRRGRTDDSAQRQARRLNDARQKFDELRQQAARASDLAANKSVRAKMEAATRRRERFFDQGAPGGQAHTAKSAPLGGIVGAIGEALFATGKDLAGAAKSMATDFATTAGTLSIPLPQEIAPQRAAAAARAMAGSGAARGTFSGVAARRMGGFLAASPMQQIARAAETTNKELAQQTVRLSQIVDAAKKAKLVFTGQLPG